jgi:hypothetical protein
MIIESKLDTYRQWIISIRPVDEGWEAKVFPKGTFITYNMEYLIELIGNYIINEVLILIANALNTDISLIKQPPSRERKYSDKRMISAYILHKKLPITQDTICKFIGWKNHASFVHATHEVENVKELQKQLESVYKMYPFLNGNSDIKIHP